MDAYSADCYHSVCRCGVEAVVAEETAGRVGGQDLPVKEHGHQIRIFGAEFHIVGNHQNRDALSFQFT